MARQQPGDLEGKRVGKYAIEKLIGSGATGDVYRARDKAEKLVALKVLAPNLTRDPDALERFKREAEVLQRLEHPNVVKVLNVGSWRGRHFIAMELLRAGTFRRMMQKSSQPKKVKLALCQVAEAVAHAHGQGVIHRDLKPENVLMNRAGKAKVADFGLARIHDQSSFTTDGAMLGTVKYMSPEQARGERADASSDVYSFGVMLYEAVAGEAPFESVTQHGFIFQHVAQRPKKPQARDGYSPALAKLAMRCLAKERDQRPTMREIADNLGSAAGWRPSRWRLYVGLVLLALLVGLGYLVFNPQALDPLTQGWAGADWTREVRDALLTLREYSPRL